MTVNASTLRSNIYRLLDDVVETGKPLTVVRKGVTLTISPVSPRGKLSRLAHRACIVGDPHAIVHLDWSKEWHDAAP